MQQSRLPQFLGRDLQRAIGAAQEFPNALFVDIQAERRKMLAEFDG